MGKVGLYTGAEQPFDVHGARCNPLFVVGIIGVSFGADQARL